MVQLIADKKELRQLEEIVEQEKQKLLEYIAIDTTTPNEDYCVEYIEKASIKMQFKKFVVYLEKEYGLGRAQALFVAMKILWDLDFKLVLENKFEVEYQEIKEKES